MDICKAATTTLALLALAAGAPRAGGQERESYSLQGFGRWAFGYTDNDNRAADIASGAGEWNNYAFALNIAARPMDKLSIRAQAFWADDRRGKRTNLDYAFAEWAESPRLKLRVGKTPVPFGIYSEVYDVGTVRPFYLLPQFYEGAIGFVPKAYVGAGATGVKPLGQKWDLQYDVVGGELRFEPYTLDRATGIDPVTHLPTFAPFENQLVCRGLIGVRLVLSSPSKGLDFGGTVLRIGRVKQLLPGGDFEPFAFDDHGKMANARIRYQKGAFAAQYEWLAALGDETDLRSSYVEASYRLGGRWQVAAQYENSDFVLHSGDLEKYSPSKFPEPTLHHESWGLALNYWVSPEFVLKLNGYRVDGNMLVMPKLGYLRAALGTIDRTTTVIVAGAQFSF